MAFKISVAPFHFWAPDVYEGTPDTFSGFMASIVKTVFFFAVFFLFKNTFSKFNFNWQILIVIMIAMTIILSNIIAVFQNGYKRLLSYSSIAQASFMFFAVLAINYTAKQGLILYSISYSMVSLALFSLLQYMKDKSIDGFVGLGKKDPLLAVIISALLFSLAGIPLTGGFISKFYMLYAVIETNNNLWLVVLAVLGSVVSVYYYFRIVRAIYFKKSEEENTIQVPYFYKQILLLVLILNIIIGIRPNWILHLFYY